jgi:hypothetical protein
MTAVTRGASVTAGVSWGTASVAREAARIAAHAVATDAAEASQALIAHRRLVVAELGAVVEAGQQAAPADEQGREREEGEEGSSHVPPDLPRTGGLLGNSRAG